MWRWIETTEEIKKGLPRAKRTKYMTINHNTSQWELICSSQFDSRPIILLQRLNQVSRHIIISQANFAPPFSIVPCTTSFLGRPRKEVVQETDSLSQYQRRKPFNWVFLHFSAQTEPTWTRKQQQTVGRRTSRRPIAELCNSCVFGLSCTQRVCFARMLLSKILWQNCKIWVT